MNLYRNRLLIALACMLLVVLPETTFAATQISQKPSDTFSGSIVVTIKPLYSLVAHITQGIQKPELLIRQTTSSHHYQLRPSNRRLLADAGVIIWIGPLMEGYLEKIIQQQKKQTATEVITALQSENLKLLTKRAKHANADPANQPYTYQYKNIDPHVWLSAHNAAAISRHIAQSLKKIDPENAERYEENLQQLLNRIESTDKFIKATLDSAPEARQKPFITYHDAFQYFEDENMLNHVGTISHDEETGASLKHIGEIKTLIESKDIHCLIYQPPKHSIIDTLITRTTIKATALDPAGMNIDDDENAWFLLMRDMATGFKQCLSH